MSNLHRRGALRKFGLALIGSGAVRGLERSAQAQRAQPKTAATPDKRAQDGNCSLAADGSPLDTGTSEIRPVIERYQVELRDLDRVYALAGSPSRQTKLEAFYASQLSLLERIDFDAMSQSGKVDYLLLRDRLLREQKQLRTEAQLDTEIAPLIPYQETIIGFEEARRRMETIDSEKTAIALTQMNASTADAKGRFRHRRPTLRR